MSNYGILALIGIVAGYFFAFCFTFYGLYLIYVAIHAAKKNGKLAATPVYVRWILLSFLVLGVSMDWIFNVVAGPVIFLETPWGHGKLFTARCHSHRQDTDWRKERADWFCDGWLNPLEAGHC